MDLVENSIRARARKIAVSVVEKLSEDRLEIIVQDDGEGMDEATLKRIWDPFFSGQKKKVGLGIPLFAQVVEQCGGKIEISSRLGQGTCLKAIVPRSHIDLPPLGNLPETLALLVVSHPEVEWDFCHLFDGRGWSFNSRAFLSETNPEEVHFVYPHLREWFQNQEDNLREGSSHEN
ncbi:MAG: ATP-binding protein [Candidatus Caldatribacteriaceae bacterium]